MKIRKSSNYPGYVVFNKFHDIICRGTYEQCASYVAQCVALGIHPGN